MRNFTVYGIKKMAWKCKGRSLCIGMTLALLLAGCSGQTEGAGVSEEPAGTDTGTGNDRGTGQSEQEALEQDPAEHDPVQQTTGGQNVSSQDVEWFTEPAARNIEFVTEAEGIYCIFANDLYGYMTVAGKEITPFTYQAASPFSEGLACVCLDGRYGYIDKNGDTALDFIYDYATSFAEGLAYYAIGDTYGFMDKSGEPVFLLDCDSVSSFQEGLAWFSVDGKYGYIDQTGGIVIEPSYDDAGYFHNGLAIVRVGGGYGVIDTFGGEVIPAIYDDLSFVGGYVMADEKSRMLWFGCNENGEMECLFSGDYIVPHSQEGTALFIYQQGEKWGVANGDGRVLFEGNSVLTLEIPDTEDRVIVMDWVDNDYALLDLQGNILVPFGCYDYMQTLSGSSLLRVEKDGKAGFYDAAALTERIPLMYDRVGWRFGEGYVSVYQSGYGWGVVDMENNTVYPTEYDSVDIYANGSVALRKFGGAVSLFNRNGQEIYRSEAVGSITLLGKCYQVWLGEDKYIFLDQDGRQIGAEYYEEAFLPRNRQENLYIAHSSTGGRDVIIQTAETEPEGQYLSEAVLKNVITPRLPDYFELFLRLVNVTGQLDSELEPGAWQKFKLYGVDGCDEPVLYYVDSYYADSYAFSFFIDEFYALEDGQLVNIVSCFQGGGAQFINSAGLRYDRENKKVVIGTAWQSMGVMGACEEIIYERQSDGFQETRTFSYDYGIDMDWYQVDGREADLEEYNAVSERYQWLKSLH